MRSLGDHCRSRSEKQEQNLKGKLFLPCSFSSLYRHRHPKMCSFLTLHRQDTRARNCRNQIGFLTASGMENAKAKLTFLTCCQGFRQTKQTNRVMDRSSFSAELLVPAVFWPVWKLFRLVESIVSEAAIIGNYTS